MTNTPETQNEHIREIALGLPTESKLVINDQKIDVKPMNFDSQLLFLQKVSKPIQKVLKANMKTDNKEEMLSSLLLAIRDLVLGSLDFEWLSLLPEATKIVTDFYKLNMSMEEVKELSIQKMIEIVLVQYECEKRTNEVANTFFMQIVNRIPGINQIQAIIEALTALIDLYNTKNSSNSISSIASASDTDATRENSPATTAGEES